MMLLLSSILLLLLPIAVRSVEETDLLNVSVFGSSLLAVHCLESSTYDFQDVVDPIMPTNLLTHVLRNIFATNSCWSAVSGVLTEDPHMITTCAGEVTHSIQCPASPDMVFAFVWRIVRNLALRRSMCHCPQVVGSCRNTTRCHFDFARNRRRGRRWFCRRRVGRPDPAGSR